MLDSMSLAPPLRARLAHHACFSLALALAPRAASAGAPEADASWGATTQGGPIITAGGLVFIGASLGGMLRAFHLETGEELWRGPDVARVRFL